MAARPDITEHDLEEITRLCALGLKQSNVADYFGVSRKTWFNMQNDDPRIRRACAKGRLKNGTVLADELRTRALAGASDPGSASLLKYACDAAGFAKHDEPEADESSLDELSDEEVKEAIAAQAREFGL